MSYLNKCDTIGRNSDVISELIQKVRRDSERRTTKLELITPEKYSKREININTEEPHKRLIAVLH